MLENSNSKRSDMIENHMDQKYTSFESFLEQLAENPDIVFENSQRKNWLKVDLLVADSNWQKLFHDYNLVKHGELYYFQMKNDKVAEYYVYEIKEGILVVLSMSNRDEYKSTLQSFIKKTRGINPAWIPANSFRETIDFIQSNYRSKIYSFTSRRSIHSKHSAKIRGDFNRSMRYSGNDADDAINELKELYGVTPTIVDFNIESKKIRITNDGFILIRKFNLRLLHMVVEIIDRAISDSIELRKISKQISYQEKETWNSFDVTKLISGKIVFNGNPDTMLISRLFKDYNDIDLNTDKNTELPKFSFINSNLSEKPLNYSAIAVDEEKGIIFGISGNSKQLVLVPKHKTSFESFINFYRLINETVDESSNLQLFNEHNKR